jgi:hypothetical protein
MFQSGRRPSLAQNGLGKQRGEYPLVAQNGPGKQFGECPVLKRKRTSSQTLTKSAFEPSETLVEFPLGGS